MDIVLELIIAIAVLLIVIVFLITRIIINKFRIFDIKFEKADKKLKKSLNEKFDLSFKTIDFLRNHINIDEDQLYEFLNVNLKKVSLIELNRIMIDASTIINNYFDQNEKLINDKAFIEINEKVRELNVSINATIKYCNDTINEYNKFIKKFPSNIIAKLTKRKSKEKFKESTKTKLKILN